MLSTTYDISTNSYPLGIVFDVDGVLFDSRKSNIKYYNLIRRSVHLPVLSEGEEEFCHMATTTEALARIIPAELQAKAYAAAQQIDYRKQILPMIEPEAGLLEALHWLKSHNIRMGVFTNRANSVGALLHSFGLESFFSPIKTAQLCKPKPDPQGLLEIMQEWNLPPHQTIFIGDSLVDEQAAFHAGTVFWAYKSADLTAKLHIHHYYDLITIVGSLLEIDN